jgi:hypothetical protein
METRFPGDITINLLRPQGAQHLRSFNTITFKSFEEIPSLINAFLSSITAPSDGGNRYRLLHKILQCLNPVIPNDDC